MIYYGNNSWNDHSGLSAERGEIDMQETPPLTIVQTMVSIRKESVCEEEWCKFPDLETVKCGSEEGWW